MREQAWLCQQRCPHRRAAQCKSKTQHASLVCCSLHHYRRTGTSFPCASGQNLGPDSSVRMGQSLACFYARTKLGLRTMSRCVRVLRVHARGCGVLGLLQGYSGVPLLLCAPGFAPLLICGSGSRLNVCPTILLYLPPSFIS